MSHLTAQQISKMGLGEIGKNVFLSDRASFHNPAGISIGDNVRIDDFCVLSAGVGGIRIGSYVHIAVYTSIIGAGPVIIEDFVNLSSRVSIYSSNDDYSGRTMTNPMVPDEYKAVENARVQLDRHVIVGSGAVILPGAALGEGVCVGALSLVRETCKPFTVWAGVPAREIGKRSRDLLDLERRLLATKIDERLS
jgi:galactoside O-acetyltransferase